MGILGLLIGALLIVVGVRVLVWLVMNLVIGPLFLLFSLVYGAIVVTRAERRARDENDGL